MSGNESAPRKEWALAGGGEMGDLMRSIDWSRNPLGPVENWPQSLRTVLSILLTSKHPIFLWWGPELIQFYNEAYRPILGGTKHPLAMGKRGRETWAEIWDVIEPMIEAVMDRGESTYIEDGLLALYRNGFLEECYFTYAYSPIRDESGGVGGIFVACSESTKRVLGERRLRVLGELGTRAEAGKGMADACRHALDILSTDRHDIPFALIYLFDESGNKAGLEGVTGTAPGGALSPLEVEWAEAGDAESAEGAFIWPLREMSATGRRVAVRLRGIEGFPLEVPVGPWPETIESALVLPLAKPGSAKPMGALITGLSPRLVFNAEYLQFLELAAGQIAATLSNVDAYDQERKRAEALITTAREIADLRAREREAHSQAEEQRYRLNSLFMEAPAPICILKGPDHHVDVVNPPYQRIFNGQHLLGKSLMEVIPDMDPSLKKILDDVYAGTPFFGREYPITVDWGQGKPERKFFSFTYQPMRNRDGVIGGVVVYAFEVTMQVDARQIAETAERETHKFLALVEQSSDFVGLANLDGRLNFINEAGRRMIGMTSPIAHADFRDMMAPEESNNGEYILSMVRESGRWEGEIRLRNAVTGKTIPVWCNFFLFKDQGSGDSTSLAIVTRNLSQLRETEEHLRHAQKMEAIGMLAGGIAHDFNNLLTAINGYGDLALDMVPAGTLHDYLREIRNGGERAATLTRQLLAYSRKQVLQPKRLNLNDIVREIQKILLRLIGEHIELEMKLAPDLGLVKADPGQMEQILLNLSLNARDAMPEGGRLVIETSNMAVDAKYAATHLDSAPGEYAVLSVTDNGIGMSKDVLGKAFEPFFTTKDVGKGTGLGLSSVYGIIKQSGGSIVAASEPGQGASFRIFLPLLKSASVQGDEPPPPAPEAAAPESRGELILLVEDESTVLTFVKRVLEQKGFRVLAARSAEEALEVAKEHDGEIDLLLTDMVMPGMNGRRLAERFASGNPQTRILFMSGYTGDDSQVGNQVDSGENFIQKPFTSAQLLERIRSLLGSGVGR
jgi:signal transduction histidine kinase/CheY-like chemotaxis protein